MKKRFATILILICMMLHSSVCAGEKIVTSFYPIWLFARELTDGIDTLEVTNLAAPDTGCLHDYQLQTGDMKTLAQADVFLINGAGMENYLEHVFEAFPGLTVITASDGIEFLTDDDIENGEDEDGGVNAHIWLDASNAAQMIHNMGEGLCQAFPKVSEQIRNNMQRATERLVSLHTELKERLSHLKRTDIITFHEAFPYFAKAYGLHVVAVVNKEPGETLSPTQMGKLIRTVQELGRPPLFTEPQYEELSAEILARETGSGVYSMDPIVTGPEADVSLDYYIQRMLYNAQIL